VNLSRKFRHNPQSVVRPLAGKDGGVVLHLESGAYHKMNSMGLEVWALIDGERSVSEIIHVVETRLGNAPPQLTDDIVGFLDGVHRRGLIDQV
jgi:hypothetical protein